jgi:hypothetical protein
MVILYTLQHTRLFLPQLSIHHSPAGQQDNPAAAAAAHGPALTQGTVGHETPQVSSSSGKLDDIKQFFR